MLEAGSEANYFQVYFIDFEAVFFLSFMKFFRTCELRIADGEKFASALNADHIKTHNKWRTCSISNLVPLPMPCYKDGKNVLCAFGRRTQVARVGTWNGVQSALLSVSVRMRTSARCTYYCIRLPLAIPILLSSFLRVCATRAHTKTRRLLRCSCCCSVYSSECILYGRVCHVASSSSTPALQRWLGCMRNGVRAWNEKPISGFEQNVVSAQNTA